MIRFALVFLWVISSLCTAAPVAAQTPTIDVQTLNATVAQKRTKPLLVHYWATWCGPCMLEMDDLIALRKRHPKDKLDMLFVSLDVDASSLERRLKTLPAAASWTNFLAVEGFMEETGIVALPRTLVYDASGRLILDHEGFEAPGATFSAVNNALGIPGAK